MNILTLLNSAPLYIICGSIIGFVAIICIVFLIRAYRMGIKMGMDKTKLKTVITSSATFTFLPSVGILLGVIALSGSLGIPWPWLRLSVIGALHYETQVAQGAAEQVGLKSLSASEMTVNAFTTIAFLMSLCIMWEMVFNLILNKRYTKNLGKVVLEEENGTKKDTKKGGFADMAMTAMFVGLVSAYIGSYFGSFISGKGLFTFAGDLTPIIVSAVSALVMAFFIWLAEKKQCLWVENFSIALSMLIGMTSAVIVNL